MPLRCGYPPPGCMTPLDCGSHRYHSSTSSSKPEHCLGAISARLARSDGREAKRRQLKHIRSEEHTSELQSLMRISSAVFCLKKKKITNKHQIKNSEHN